MEIELLILFRMTSKKDVKLVFIAHRSTHHAMNSGYSLMAGKYYIKERKVLPYFIRKYLSSKFDQTIGIYDSNSLSKELSALITGFFDALKGKKVVFYYLNGERDMRIIPKLFKNFRNVKIGASFHKPITYFNSRHLEYCSKQIDFAVVVGLSQIKLFKNYDIPTFYIPHGVNTEYFIPENNLKKNNVVLFVGQHLRDFKTFNKVTGWFTENHSFVQFICILREEYKNKITPRNNVDIRNNISDEELRYYYQTSRLLFLPLIDVTACNSILEALSSGLPIVTSRLISNQSYLKHSSNSLVNDDDDIQFAKEIEKVLFNKVLAEDISKSNRDLSINYDWINVRKSLQNVIYKLYDQ